MADEDQMVSFTAPQSPEEMAIREQQIARQRAIAAGLQQQSMQNPGVQMMGRVAVAPSALSGVARLVQAYMGRKGQDSADEAAFGLARQKRDYTTQAIKGTLAGVEGLTPEERASMEAGLTSGNPAAVAMVTNALKLKQERTSKQWEKNNPGITDLSGVSSPESVLAAVQGGTGVAGLQPKVTVQDVAGAPMQLKNGLDGLPTLMPLGGYPKLTTEMHNGDFYQKDDRTGKLTKLDNAPKITMTNNINNSVGKGENKFMEGMGTGAADAVNAARVAKQSGEKTIAVINNLERLDKAGTFTGPTANVATSLNALADAFGIPVDKGKLGRSQEYTGVLAQQISSYLTAGSGVGRSLTDADREAIQKQFAQLITTPEGRKRIFNSMRNAADRDIEYARGVEKNLHDNFPEAEKLFNVAPSMTTFPTDARSAEPAPAQGGTNRRVVDW